MLGITLFAALSFVVSSGMRSASTTQLSSREATLAASDILAYAQKTARAVDRLRQKSVSENDISFNLPGDDDTYDHGQPQTHHIFHPNGGALNLLNPPSGVNDGSSWLYTAQTCLPEIGTGERGCHSDGENNEELIAVLPHIKEIVCRAINARLDIPGIPEDTGTGYSNEPFRGVFHDETYIETTTPYETACVKHRSELYFYRVLLAH